MKMIDPTAMSRFTALWEAARKIARLVPPACLMEQPPTKAGIPPPWRWNFPRRW